MLYKHDIILNLCERVILIWSWEADSVPVETQRQEEEKEEEGKEVYVSSEYSVLIAKVIHNCMWSVTVCRRQCLVFRVEKIDTKAKYS